jgi:hypothetical protein
MEGCGEDRRRTIRNALRLVFFERERGAGRSRFGWRLEYESFDG